MPSYPKALSALIEEFRKLPGVGPKTAQRLALHLVVSGKSSINRLISSLEEARDQIGYCSICGNLTDTDPCIICADSKRDKSVICVVGYPKDVLAIERAGGYQGVYHVLHGYIEPLKGVGPDDIRVKELLGRVKEGKGEIKEVILATNPDIDGETTALYLARALKPLGVRVTRLARGLPFGADLDYADEVTLAKSLEGRREM
ncbi:MAG: recombination protein RecR [Candidatus Fermentithermobacillus carboniphilus]|uniref:Recombination protein RecR n=1 Tax=Candidatus Fermentithermobacillus carboniphilus TaxID=3085328 RepID=A0AAT9LBF5_9FIRM|nr:MAG: recombination protein RecR [Candidatus Fermentithermobacillus carboniphilus]